MHPKVNTLLFCLLFLFGTHALAAKQLDWSTYEPVLEWKTTTIEALADRIATTYTTDTDRAAAIYYWIANNLSYDTGLMRRVTEQKQGRRYDKEELERLYEDRITYAWEKRRGVCENYARLYERMAELAGVEAEMIVGNARGDYLQAGSLGIGHAWNAVKIDGRWELLDATWGAGHLNERLRFVAEFKPQYFFPDRRALSYSHFPRDAKWQLLAEPVGEETFLDGVAVGEGFLKYDLRELSHPTYVLKAKRNQPLVITAVGENLPSQFATVNLTTRNQIESRSEIEDGRIRISIPAERVRNMKLAVLDPRGDVILAYKIVVR